MGTGSQGGGVHACSREEMTFTLYRITKSHFIVCRWTNITQKRGLSAVGVAEFVAYITKIKTVLIIVTFSGYQLK